VNGWNSTNPTIWLVPGAGGIFPSSPLSAGGIVACDRHLLKNVSSLSGNDLCYYVSKNLSVKPLSSTWIISVFITICSPEIVQFVTNLAMITALKFSGLSHAFRCVAEKNKKVTHQPRSARIGKNYGPPSWWIPYIYYNIVKGNKNVEKKHRCHSSLNWMRVKRSRKIPKLSQLTGAAISTLCLVAWHINSHYTPLNHGAGSFCLNLINSNYRVYKKSCVTQKQKWECQNLSLELWPIMLHSF